MEKLQIKRPLAFIDLETTGINIASDRIIEIAIIKIMPYGTSQSKVKRLNPGMPIPKESSDVHGITDADVKDSPAFREVANELRQFLDNCDLAGYNSNRFDIPLLVEEFLRAGQRLDTEGRKFVDVQRIFHMMEKRTLEAAYMFYCKKVLNEAHTAEADARATFEILEAQVNLYAELKNDIEELAKFTFEDDFIDFARRIVRRNGVEIFNFGKYKGKAVRDVLRDEPQYYDWMMKADFPLHTKQKLSEIYNDMMLKKS
jgi:DNA polymerase-3 subunit epsilon